MLKIFLLGVYASYAADFFVNPKLTENLEDTPKLQQCMREQVATALGNNPTDIWGFQGPFLITGSPKLVEYKVRLKSGYPYKMRFTTDEQYHWKLFHYVCASGATHIGARSENMWNEAFLLDNNYDRDPIFVDLTPCREYIESK